MSEEYEEIELELDEDLFNILISEASERDLTINEYVNDIIKDYLEAIYGKSHGIF